MWEHTYRREARESGKSTESRSREVSEEEGGTLWENREPDAKKSKSKANKHFGTRGACERRGEGPRGTRKRAQNQEPRSNDKKPNSEPRLKVSSSPQRESSKHGD
ncbi:uncharacterized protein G2W53_029273 [Senna tora]|uniref:Uncharacterized protein n=1 Tax=Senna tora TaxID=362788 RepID=A0A834T3Z2_9FABA|nr:uncharacterized protein G2W53_029273 [Senna tora]